MNTVLSFMDFLDKLYSDKQSITIVYVVGVVLLLLFIVMLMFSLRKPSPKKLNSKVLNKTKDEVKPIEEEKVSEDNSSSEVVETKKSEIKEETKKEEVLEDKKEETTEVTDTKNEDKDVFEEENVISKALDNVENKDIMNITETEKEEPKEINVSSEIPDVDEFVDKVVKKTYEKNEQFSSVYVGDNTTTIKLDKVLDDLNVDEDIKVDILPEEEKPLEIKDETKEDTASSLDSLKKSLEEKKKEVNLKQDELASKLAGLKETKKEDVMKAEDLLSKLNSMKEEKDIKE